MKRCRTGERTDLEIPVSGVGFRGLEIRAEGVGQVYGIWNMVGDLWLMLYGLWIQTRGGGESPTPHGTNPGNVEGGKARE